MQLQPHIVVAEPLDRQPTPSEGEFSILDALLDGAMSIEGPHNPVRLHRHVPDDEAHALEEVIRIPFDLGGHAALLVLCLVGELS